MAQLTGDGRGKRHTEGKGRIGKLFKFSIPGI
jgi:hypothetical protein